jgi:hypothetical protein
MSRREQAMALENMKEKLKEIDTRVRSSNVCLIGVSAKKLEEMVDWRYSKTNGYVRSRQARSRFGGYRCQG